MNAKIIRAISIIMVTAICMNYSSLAISETTPNPTKTNKVIVLLKTLTNPFFIEIDRGVKNQAGKKFPQLGIVTKGGANEGDADFQAKELASNVESNFSCLIITPSNPMQIAPKVKPYFEKRIPVVVVDTPFSQKVIDDYGLKFRSTIASDNFRGAEAVAKSAIKKLGFITPDISVLVVGGVASHTSSSQRVDGFMSALKAAGISGDHIQTRYADWRKEKAYNDIFSLYSSGKRFDLILASNDNMAIGVAEALRRFKLDKKPIVTGFDNLPTIAAYLQSEDIFATVKQDAFGMGVAALDACFDDQANSTVNVPVVLVCGKNGGESCGS